MADILDSLAELEGHEFTHAGHTYSVVTVTANRNVDQGSGPTDAPVLLHFTVTTDARPAPIGLQLRVNPAHAGDIAYVRQALENTVASIVDSRR
jgi:hypothetical protein